jgi:hypothetical protein
MLLFAWVSTFSCMVKAVASAAVAEMRRSTRRIRSAGCFSATM